MDVLFWLVVAIASAVSLTQLSNTSWWAVPQALTPWFLLPCVPVGLAAAWSHRWGVLALAAANTVTLAVLAGPLLRPYRRRADATGVQVVVLYANVKYDQATPEAAAGALRELIERHRVDVLAVSEATVQFAEALEELGIDETMPYRIGAPVVGPEASVIWTRMTVLARGEPGPGPTWDADATLAVAGTTVRVVATHPLPPVGATMRPHWQPGLMSTAERARRPGPATLVVGDLNAARWHRPWRRFVGHDFVSAHERLGRGWSSSWPADRWWPPFVRLDHALCGPGLIPVSVIDVVVPGSDHRGFVVTVAANARTARPR
jgi:endonuclease/exonuclease/phosphatase (EEP) superfamily protein YafD